MSYSAVTLSNSTHRPAAFRAVYVRESGSGFWQTLGSIAKGVLSFKNYAEGDSMSRNKAHAIGFTASCNMKQASLIELRLLDSLLAGNVDFLFRLADAVAIPAGPTAIAAEGWVYVSAAQVGIKAKVNLDGTPETPRTIALEWQGSLQISEWAAAVKAVICDTDFNSSTGSGTFQAIGVYTTTTDGGKPNNTHIVANGATKVEIAESGGSYVNLGTPKDFKCTLEFLSDPDDLKRHQCFAMKIAQSYDWMQTDAADLLNLQSNMQLDVDVKTTFGSGLIMTLSNQVGISTEYSVSGDMDKMKVVKFDHNGSINTTSVDGIFSGS